MFDLWKPKFSGRSPDGAGGFYDEYPRRYPNKGDEPSVPGLPAHRYDVYPEVDPTLNEPWEPGEWVEDHLDITGT